MSRTQRILWGEGVFLRPQHFQQQELHQEAQLARWLSCMHAHPWGVATMTLDRDALPGDILNVTRLDLAFQDGTYFEAPGQEPLPIARRLDSSPGWASPPWSTPACPCSTASAAIAGSWATPAATRRAFRWSAPSCPICSPTPWRRK